MKDVQKMKTVVWDVTNLCNLRCTHCYNANLYFDKDSKWYICGELDQEAALQAVDRFAENGVNHIHFLGGEPLLAKNIFAIIRRAKEYDMCVTINSNATLLSDQMIEQLIAFEIDHFCASLDGATEKTNDAIRGDGTFDIVCRNMKKFTKKMLNQ